MNSYTFNLVRTFLSFDNLSLSLSLSLCSMNEVYFPYFDPDFDKLPERINGPK